MYTQISIALTAAVLGAYLAKYLGWAIRAWPGHEAFHCDYLHCATCEGGIKRACFNAGTGQDKAYIVLSALTAGLSFYFFGISAKAAFSWFFAMACLIVTVVDYRYYIIPDRISIGGCWLGLAYGGLCTIWVTYLGKVPFSYHIDFKESLFGFALGFGGLKLLALLALLILRKEGMGGGDVKLLGAMGAFLGWRAVLIIMITASFIGSIGGVGSIIYSRIRHKKGYEPLSHMIPFGPYLCIAFLAIFYLGEEPFMRLLEAYQNWILSTGS